MIDHLTGPSGRPLSLEGRLEAMATILESEGYDLTPETIQAMAWWEESAAPFLDGEVEPTEWHRGPDAPHSLSVTEVMQRWSAENEWRRLDDTPIRFESMTLGDALTARGKRWSGLDEITLHTAPSEFLPWYRAMTYFVRGFQGEDTNLRVGTMNGGADIRRMIMADKTFLSGEWERTGGPGKVSVSSGKDGIAGEFTGNGFAHAMHYWMTVPVESLGRAAAKHRFEAMYLLGRMLVRWAAEKFPEFGERRFLEIRDEIVALETSSSDGTVTTEFQIAGDLVAIASWKPGKKTHQWTRASGRTFETEIDDGTLLRLQVIEGHRRKGIGTYVLRHAMTKGCVRAFQPTPEYRPLWTSHGWPEGEDWKLDRSSWPLCKIETRVLAPGPDHA